MQNINPLSVTLFVNIFSHSVGYFLILSTASFAVQKLLSRCHLFIFALFLLATGLEKYWCYLCQKVFCLCSLLQPNLFKAQNLEVFFSSSKKSETTSGNRITMCNMSGNELKKVKNNFFFFFFFCFLVPRPQHMEVPQARGPVGTTAASLYHSHSNEGSEHHCDLHHSSWQH